MSTSYDLILKGGTVVNRDGEGVRDVAVAGGSIAAIGDLAQVPIILDHVAAGRLSLLRFVDLTSAGPARLFGIACKGRIAVGYEADLTVVDLKRRETITDDWIRSRAGWTPYDGVGARRGGELPRDAGGQLSGLLNRRTCARPASMIERHAMSRNGFPAFSNNGRCCLGSVLTCARSLPARPSGRRSGIANRSARS
jgi:amidohydrolase family protein